MAHNHENCTRPTDGAHCLEGHLTDTCGDDNCFTDYCMSVGHCKCKCHTNKYCGMCGEELTR